MRMRILPIFTIVCFCLLLSGCGDGNVPLSGRVTFEDGIPLQCGTVTFCNDAFQQARGNIDPNGYYTVGFLHEKDGLPPGNYRIFITGTNETSDDSIVPVMIAAQYGDPNTSGLTVNVNSKTKTHDIHLKRNVSNDD